MSVFEALDTYGPKVVEGVSRLFGYARMTMLRRLILGMTTAVACVAGYALIQNLAVDEANGRSERRAQERNIASELSRIDRALAEVNNCLVAQRQHDPSVEFLCHQALWRYESEVRNHLPEQTVTETVERRAYLAMQADLAQRKREIEIEEQAKKSTRLERTVDYIVHSPWKSALPFIVLIPFLFVFWQLYWPRSPQP